jgi:hypothetical protein
VRAALLASLQFFDEYPEWARFLLLEPSVATIAIAERRQRALRKAAAALEHEALRTATGRRRLSPSSQLTSELVVGGVFSVLRTQLLDRSAASFGELAPSLMAFVVKPYEQVAYGGSEIDDEIEYPPVRATYRTTEVLAAVNEAPRSNNREVALAAGLRDEGQTSKLLTRLERRGLLENVGLGAAYGEPNAWLLTPYGKHVLAAARHSRIDRAEGSSQRGPVSKARARFPRGAVHGSNSRGPA